MSRFLRSIPPEDRRERVNSLIAKIEVWEQEGLDVFAQLHEWSAPESRLAAECRRFLKLLEG
jgi:hypothetical protein